MSIIYQIGTRNLELHNYELLKFWMFEITPSCFVLSDDVNDLLLEIDILYYVIELIRGLMVAITGKEWLGFLSAESRTNCVVEVWFKRLAASRTEAANNNGPFQLIATV